MSDITERKRAERQLIHDAFHDMLTHLPNRALVLDRLEHALKRSKRNENFLFAVLFLDLDRFKIVNDSLGHEAGDRLLIELAGRLSRCLRPGDTLSRLGGDEFVILLEDIRGDEDVKKVAERIINMVKDPFVIDGQEVCTTVSIGIALSSSDYERPEDMLRDADTAMYRAKSLGKARYEMFDTTMHLNVLNMLRLENDLRKALDRDQLRIHYQPVVSLENGHVNSVEALLRWYHPERGVIPPMEFIPLAEENGMIIPIGEWVLRTACHQLRLLFEDGFTPLRIAVNISARQLRQGMISPRTWCASSRKPASMHGISNSEITESTIMENPDSAAEKLAKLRELGVHISLDDFGTGYSSLSYLHRFPINTLKIDRSFIERMGSDAEKFEIIRSVVSMAKKMALSVVAEGIETVEQMRNAAGAELWSWPGFSFRDLSVAMMCRRS
ncbi:MAG: EAL domain-containing protein [Desulfobacterales bacterium]|nr:EAL domain-containing protein [Desulfobacterales bacterium]